MEEIKYDLSNLTSKEKDYFLAMLPINGVPFLKAKPGVAKSAIVESIANKLGFLYIDLRLSQIEPTDIGLYPYLEDTSDGNKIVRYAIPEWAILANEQPTIIHFEELNRSATDVRNAALQILNERRIGYRFKFNKDVFMICSGNLGDDDGTEIIEIDDNALKTRLIHINHTLTVDEWLDYANKSGINPYIIKFIKENPSYFYFYDEKSDTYANPRTWSFLSAYLNKLIEINPLNENIKKIKNIKKICGRYVGTVASIKFIDSLNDILTYEYILSNDDIDEMFEKINDCPDDRKNGILNEIKKNKIYKYTTKEFINICEFINTLNDEKKVTFLHKIIDAPNLKNDIVNNKNIMYHNIQILCKYFKDDLIEMRDKIKF